MRLLIPVNCCILLFVLTIPAGAQQRHEPRIKFLDDLFSGWRATSERDPYEERIETERHDFTQSTKTVGRGVMQVEAGYTYFYKDEYDEIESSHATPEIMFRLGLTDDIEFRLRWNYAWRFVNEGDSFDSAEDLHWSFKLGITDQEHWIPESALEIRGTVPTGGGDWTTGRVAFGLDYIYAWALSDRLIVYGSSGFGTDGLGDFSLLPEDPLSDYFVAWTQSAALGLDLTEQTTIYVEYFALFSSALEDSFSINFFNMGVDYYVTDDFVLDVRVGVGLSPDADDLFSGIGASYRF